MTSPGTRKINYRKRKFNQGLLGLPSPPPPPTQEHVEKKRERNLLPT